MRRITVFLILFSFFIPWHPSFSAIILSPKGGGGKVDRSSSKPLITQTKVGYCEGHARKVVNVLTLDSSALFEAVQTELNQYNSSEYDYNGRYELCFELRIQGNVHTVDLSAGQTLTLTNTSKKEVVIGFLNATRSDDSTTPIIQIHGHSVTIFQPTFSNVKKAVTFDGNGHKLIGGTITGIPNQADSLCVDGTGNNITIQDAAINDCVNAIRLNGDGSRVSGGNISFLRLASAPHLETFLGEGENAIPAFISAFEQWREDSAAVGNCIDLHGQNYFINNTIVNGCLGTGIKIVGSGKILGSQITGEAIPSDVTEEPLEHSFARRSADCLFLQDASDITLESNAFSQCQTGVHIVDSSSISIGPDLFEDFATKKNEIHHNDYAIHVETSQTVYARHNSVPISLSLSI